MEIIKKIFETGSVVLILILIFLPIITFIVQLIANIKIIKKLPEIDYKLKLIYKKIYNLENDNSKEKTNKEVLENLEQIEINNNNKEYMITTIFIAILIIFITLIIINFK